mgnify:FL=1
MEVADGLADIRRLTGFHSVDSDAIDAHGHRLFFDEKRFIRQQSGAGRIRLDTLASVAGRVVPSGGGRGPPGPAPGPGCVVEFAFLER